MIEAVIRGAGGFYKGTTVEQVYLEIPRRSAAGLPIDGDKNQKVSIRLRIGKDRYDGLLFARRNMDVVWISARLQGPDGPTKLGMMFSRLKWRSNDRVVLRIGGTDGKEITIEPA